MRVNHQNYVRLIGLFILLAVAAFSVQVHAQDNNKKVDVELLKSEAERGIVESQYYLGMIYQKGDLIDQNLMLSYVWLSVAAKQGHDEAELEKEKVFINMHRNYRASAKAMVSQYYKKYALPYLPPFELSVNGEKVTKSAAVSVETPLYIIFKHIDPNIHIIRMLYPKNMHRHEDFETNRPYRMEKHEALLDAGRTSGAMFMAIDGKGNVHDKVKVIFKPKPKDEKSEEKQGEKTEAGTE